MKNHVLWLTAKDTIAAMATASGPGSVSIIRLSGPQASAIAQNLCKIDMSGIKANCFRYAKIFNTKGIFLDGALILRFTAPKSFTGEDIIEIQCHGGPFIGKQILATCLECGARLAEPGEFSYRAFRNQKIDLCQAESLCSLISAKNAFTHRAAQDQLQGALSIKIQELQHKIIEIVATLEAMIDYPEDGIHYPSKQELQEKIFTIEHEISKLMATFHDGQKLSDSVKVAIVGRANVGKSSLLNLLLMKDRAIVADLAGTTRDQIEEEIVLNERTFRFIDTAGIRKTDDKIEMLGIERAKTVIQTADLILFLIDSSQAMQNDEKDLLRSLDPTKTLVVFNKADLKKAQNHVVDFQSLSLSTKTSLGLDELKTWLLSHTPVPNEALFVTQKRHFMALKKASDQLNHAKIHLDTAPAEITAIDLRESLAFLTQIIGKNISEEILSSIFQNFCVGK